MSQDSTSKSPSLNEKKNNKKEIDEISKKKNVKSQIIDLLLFRTIPSGVKVSALLMISLGIFFIIPLKWSRSIEFLIPINIYELGSQGAGLFFKIDLKHVLYIILLGPVFSLIAYQLISPLWKVKTLYKITQLESGQKSNKKIRENLRLITFYEISIIFFIIMNSVGHFVHMLFDKANYYYRNGLESYDTSEVFKFVYFSDEWLGHGIIHVSYFMIFFLAIFLEYENIKIKRNMSINSPSTVKWFNIAGSTILNIENTQLDSINDQNISLLQNMYDKIFYIIALLLSSAGLSGLHGLAALEGESALILLILSILGLIILILWVLRKKFKFKELVYSYPLVLINILAFIGVIIQNIIFIQSGYWINQYPYIT